MRSNSVYYLPPSACSIIANANDTANDIAVNIADKTEIQVYCKNIAVLDTSQDGTYQSWSLLGKNRSLAESDKTYTIYARLSKTDKTDGYLVFAPKVQQGGVWKDKYPYVTIEGLATDTAGTATGNYWYIKMGTVSAPVNGVRTLDFDTGILGTPQYNEEWNIDPDSLPYKVEITNSKITSPPYVEWGDSITLTANLIQGWESDANAKVTAWTIERDTSDTESDEEWNDHHSLNNNRQIILEHLRGTGLTDDFNEAVTAAFIITAWGEDSESSGSSSSGTVMLARGSITILAETLNQYKLDLSTRVVTYNPKDDEYTPDTDITIRLKAITQDETISFMTAAQIAAAGLKLYYELTGGDSSDSGSSDEMTELTFSGTGSNPATATLPISVFEAQQSVNLHLYNINNIEVDDAPIAFVKDGEDGETVWTANLNNTLDSVSCDDTGYVISTQTVSSVISLFYGNTPKGFSLTSLKRNGTAIVLDTATNGVTPRFASNTLTLSYGTTAKINNKDVYEITITATDNPSVTRILEFTVKGVNGDVYNLKPSSGQLNVPNTNTGTTAALTCGYTKKALDGTITEHTLTAGDPTILTIDGKYNVFYRRRLRTTGNYENTYYNYVYNWDSALDVHTYDRVEFVICNATGASQADLTNYSILDTQTVPVLSNGENGKDAATAVITLNPASVETDYNGRALATSRREFAISLQVNGNNCTLTQIAYTKTGAADVVLTDSATGTTAVSSPITNISATSKTLYLYVAQNATGIDGSILFAVTGTYGGKTYVAPVGMTINKNKQGAVGPAGPTINPCGLWVAGNEYYNNASRIDAVIDPEDGLVYKLENGISNYSSNVAPHLDPTHWVQATDLDFLSTKVFITENGYGKILGAGEMWVGSNDKEQGVNGWIISQGAITHNVTQLQLTEDGYIKDPDGLHFIVGNNIGVNANLLHNPYFDMLLTEIYDDGSQIPESYLNLLQQDSIHGSNILRLDVEDAGSVETRWMGGIKFNSPVKLLTNTQYTFSAYIKFNGEEDVDVAWLKLYKADNEGLTSNLVEIATINAPFKNGWQLVSHTFSLGGTNKYFAFKIGVSTQTGGVQFDIDSVKLEIGSQLTAMCDETLDDKLLPTGIDIENRTLRLTADNLICQNNDGEKTMWLDSIGNIATTGNIMSGVRNIGSTTDFAKIAYYIGEVTLYDCDTIAGAATNKVYNNLSDRGISGFTWSQLYKSWVLDVFRTTDIINFTQSFGGNDDDINIVLPFFVFKEAPEDGQGHIISYDYYVCRTYTNYKTGSDHLIRLDEMQQLIGRKFTFTGNGTYKRLLIPNVIERVDGGQYYYEVDSLNPFIEYELRTQKGFTFEYQAYDVRHNDKNAYSIFPRCVAVFKYLNEVQNDWGSDVPS